MTKYSFLFPMKKSEKIFGWLYVFIHSVALVFLMSVLNNTVFASLGIKMDTAHLNLAYYVVSFVLVFLFMFRFLRASFSDLCDNIWRTLSSLVLGYALYYVLLFVVSFGLSHLLSDLANPNSELIAQEAKLNSNVLKASAILLAPVVEEVLFRGVVFGTVRKKSRILAYAVSTLVFCFYHLWQYFLTSFDWTLLLYMLQYVPGSIALAWCYERSRNIWGPVFLHMAINFISFAISFG